MAARCLPQTTSTSLPSPSTYHPAPCPRVSIPVGCRSTVKATLPTTAPHTRNAHAGALSKPPSGTCLRSRTPPCTECSASAVCLPKQQAHITTAQLYKATGGQQPNLPRLSVLLHTWHKPGPADAAPRPWHLQPHAAPRRTAGRTQPARGHQCHRSRGARPRRAWRYQPEAPCGTPASPVSVWSQRGTALRTAHLSSWRSDKRVHGRLA